LFRRGGDCRVRRAGNNHLTEEVKAMIQETIGITGTVLQRPPLSAAEKVENGRKDREQQEEVQAGKPTQEEEVPAEELLNKIKGLTEDDQYSLRFETDQKSDSLVVKVVDSKSGDIIRQVPSEELLNLRERLTEFQGNFINTIT
jgi:flagellar protein FlaG